MFLLLLASMLVSEPDDTIVHELEQFIVVSNCVHSTQLNSSQPSAVVDKSYIQTHFSGSLAGTLGHVAGVQAMSVGSSVARPAIRGLGFNRLAVMHDDVRHEGQQWGDDHGLEIDRFALDQIEVVKGPAALLYGSDAVGGALLLSSNRRPTEPLQGSVSAFFRSNNLLWGTSLHLQGIKNRFYWRMNATYQDYADYKVPTDNVQYYSYRIPLYKQTLRNTAGREVDASAAFGFMGRDFHSCIKVFETFQRSGFFANAHGLEVRLSDIDYDKSRRDTDLPYQQVNHIKVISHSVWERDKINAELNFAWQNNRREEHSEPVSHGYMPKPSSTLERRFNKHIATVNANVRYDVHERHTLRFGVDAEAQFNRIGGWGFIIPEFEKYSAGVFAMERFQVNDNLALNGGVRYDYSHIDIHGYSDWYKTPVEGGQQYLQRAADMSRDFHSFTWSVGLAYSKDIITLKFNAGKSFRTPIAKELGADGVNYHIFRYEQGNSGLDAEQSYQADVSLQLRHAKVEWTVEPFANYFPNYIYLCPTAEYHEGLQLYRYSQSRVFRTGVESTLLYKPWRFIHFLAQAEYLFARQLSGDKKGYSLPFSPPWNVEAEVKYLFCLNQPGNEGFVAVNVHVTGAQRDIVPPEKETEGWWTLNMSAGKKFSFKRTALDITLNADNILNRRYYDHTSYYRLIDVPEPGWNISTIITLSF